MSAFSPGCEQFEMQYWSRKYYGEKHHHEMCIGRSCRTVIFKTVSIPIILTPFLGRYYTCHSFFISRMPKITFFKCLIKNPSDMAQSINARGLYLCGFTKSWSGSGRKLMVELAKQVCEHRSLRSMLGSL